jgi:hypothetical protein
MVVVVVVVIQRHLTLMPRHAVVPVAPRGGAVESAQNDDDDDLAVGTYVYTEDDLKLLGDPNAVKPQVAPGTSLVTVACLIMEMSRSMRAHYKWHEQKVCITFDPNQPTIHCPVGDPLAAVSQGRR